MAYEWNGGSFTQLPATNTSIPLSSIARVSTLQASPPIDGRQEIGGPPPRRSATMSGASCRRLRGPRHAVAGRLSTLNVTVRNRSRTLAQDLIVRAYLPPRLRVVDLPRGARVSGDRVVWRFSKLRRRHARSLRLRVVSARTGRRCTAVSADAVLRGHATAKACIDVRAAAPPRITG